MKPVSSAASELADAYTLEARSAFRRGNRIRAFRIMTDHIDELVSADNMHAVSIVCIEYINMMTAVERLDDAAYMLAYRRPPGCSILLNGAA